MRKSSFIVVFIAAAAVTLTSCGRDKEEPSITISTPVEHSEFALGDVIHVDAMFMDNKDLASYTVEVGDVNGEHLHEFHNDDSGTISGKEYHYHNMITIPAGFSTDIFYLHFTVKDAKDNETTKKWMLHIAP